MYVIKVWESVWPEGQEAIHSYLGSQDVTYSSLYPMPLPPRGRGQRSKVVILPTSGCNNDAAVEAMRKVLDDLAWNVRVGEFYPDRSVKMLTTGDFLTGDAAQLQRGAHGCALLTWFVDAVHGEKLAYWKIAIGLLEEAAVQGLHYPSRRGAVTAVASTRAATADAASTGPTGTSPAPAGPRGTPSATTGPTGTFPTRPTGRITATFPTSGTSIPGAGVAVTVALGVTAYNSAGHYSVKPLIFRPTGTLKKAESNFKSRRVVFVYFLSCFLCHHLVFILIYHNYAKKLCT
jgi:hypothetical protein